MTHEPNTPIFAYLRKSSRSDEMQTLSIPRQRAELQNFLQREGLRIKREFIERESAKSPGRPIFDEMLRRIEAGEAAGIVAWHPDRLARNAVDGGRIIDLLDRKKLFVLKFASFWFENNPQGRFMLMMAFAQSAHYVDALSVNTKSGLNRKVARGEYPGVAPIGYLNDRRKKRIVIDRERAPIIRELFERYGTGSDSLDDLREFLGSRNVTSKKDPKKLITRIRVGKILRDPIYYGSFKWGGEVHPGTHEPIITRELFTRAQAVRTRRIRFHVAKALLKPIPYRRTLICSTCGNAITAEIQKGHTYYRCSRRLYNGIKCKDRYVREESIDQQITELIKPFAMPTDVADDFLSRIEQERVNASQTAVALIDENCRKIATLNASLVTLQDGLVDGLFDHEYVQSKRETLVALRRELESKNGQLTDDSTAWLEPFREWVSTARSIAETASNGSKEAKASLARNIFGSNLHLMAGKAQGRAVKPWSYLTQRELGDTIVPLWTAVRTHFQSMSEVQSVLTPRLEPFKDRSLSPGSNARPEIVGVEREPKEDRVG